MHHGPRTVRGWSILLAASLLASVSKARELSLYRIEDDVEAVKSTNTFKRRTVYRQAAGAPGSNTIERALSEAPPIESLSEDIFEEDSNEDSEITEELEEERLHRERREMFFRNLQMDAGGATSLSLGATGTTSGINPFLDMSMSLPMAPVFEGETRSSRVTIDLLTLRNRAYEYAEEHGNFLTGETRSGVKEEESTIDLLELRANALEHHEQEKTLAEEHYLRSGIRNNEKQE